MFFCQQANEWTVLHSNGKWWKPSLKTATFWLKQTRAILKFSRCPDGGKGSWTCAVGAFGGPAGTLLAPSCCSVPILQLTTGSRELWCFCVLSRRQRKALFFMSTFWTWQIQKNKCWRWYLALNRSERFRWRPGNCAVNTRMWWEALWQQESQKETENQGRMRATLKKGFTAGCLTCFHFNIMSFVF